MDTSVYRTGKYFQNSDTKLLCPDCNTGHLISKKENLHIIDYKHYNEEAQKHKEFDPDWLKFAFYGFLQCNNPDCLEKIVVSGNYEYGGWYGDEDGEHGMEMEEYYPHYFERPPKIITIYDKYPKDIQDILKSSFSLFWLDKSSCANRLRLCLENVLDTFSIPRITIDGKYINFQTRIELFYKTNNNEKYKTILTAAKWIGNTGTHSTTIYAKNILDAYRLIDFMLKELYINVDEEKEILKLSEEINRKKGI